jgi:hypothetical protein
VSITSKNGATIAHCVPGPPEEPREAVGARQIVREPQNGDSVRRADRGAYDGAEQDQRKHVSNAIERRAEASACQKRAADNCLKGVADGDRERNRNRRTTRRVCDERRDQDRRPQPAAEEDQRRERDPSRRPHGRDHAMRHRKREPKLRGTHIYAPDHNE